MMDGNEVVRNFFNSEAMPEIRVSVDLFDCYTVRWGNVWEDMLTKDEVLGTIASILYAGKACFLKNDFEHILFNAKYGERQKLLTEAQSE
jgi:hypothetical protein